MQIIRIVYNCNVGEATPRLTKGYHELPDTLQMDCLIDAIYYLENIRKELHDRMYPKSEVKTYET